MSRLRLSSALGALAVAALLLVPLKPASADRGGWEFLGSRMVDDRVDRDEIEVTAAKGDFKALKLVVKRRAVHILDMKVHFGSGGTQDVEVRQLIPAGGETRVIDLRGSDRFIRKVVFWYEAKSLRGRKAEVHLWGLH